MFQSTKGNCKLAALGSCLTLMFLWPLQANAKSAAGFIWLSDLHFDPTANPTLVDALARAPIEEWPRILASSPASFSTFGEDANWALLSSSLEAIRKIASDEQFVVVTGDLLVHHFQDKFKRAAKDNDEESFRRFAEKTMRFIAVQVASLVPGKPVFLALGNNDNECGDYELAWISHK